MEIIQQQIFDQERALYGSRDLLDPYFAVRDGIEYCYVGSYLFRDLDTIPTYQGEDFSSPAYNPGYNSVYRLTSEVKQLPEVPTGRRLIILNKELSVVYDSQVKGEYKPINEGYINFI